MIATEKTKEVKAKNLWVGISLIVIGILIIVGGAVGYYIEKANCPTELGCGILTYWGGLGFFGLTFLGSIFIIPGIIYPYRKRIKGGYYCILLVGLPLPMAYFLAWLIILIL